MDRLSLLLVAVALVLLSCAVHGTADDCSTSTSMAIGTTNDGAQLQDDSGKNGDCRNHTHTHGHHGDSDSDSGSDGKDKDKDKDKPGTPPPATVSGPNPWVLTSGAAAPRAQVVSGWFTAATSVIIHTAAAVFWWLAT